MDIALVVIGSALLGYAAWAVLTWADPARSRRASRARARRLGFGLDPDVAGTVVPRLAERAFVGAAGGVLGGAGMTAWLAGAGLSGGPGWLLVWSAVGVLVGRSVALAGLALVQARRAVAAPGPRVARAGCPTPGDYVAAPERGLAVVLSGLPIVLVAGWWASTAAEVEPGVAALAAVPLVVLLGGLALARRITAGPQPAASPQALAWDDALRARTLRDVVSAVTLVGVSYCLLTTSVLGAVPFTTSPVAPPVTVVLAGIFLGCGVVPLVCALTPSPGSHFRRRLWADDPSSGGVGRTATATSG